MNRQTLPNYNDRGKAFIELLRERILVLDGAMGTMLQQAGLTASDFGGPELEGCNENLVLTRPDVVRSIHEAYFAAGADIVETNSFGATPTVPHKVPYGDERMPLGKITWALKALVPSPRSNRTTTPVSPAANRK